MLWQISNTTEIIQSINYFFLFRIFGSSQVILGTQCNLAFMLLGCFFFFSGQITECTKQF